MKQQQIHSVKPQTVNERFRPRGDEKNVLGNGRYPPGKREYVTARPARTEGERKIQ